MSIIIEGDNKFVTQTQKVLSLLKKSVPRFYKQIIPTGIKKIKPHRTSGMNVFAKVPTYEVGKRTAFSPLKWYASTIAHDAYHSKLYFDYRSKHKGRVPRQVFASPKAERKCIKFQIKVAEKIGASAADIKYLESLGGSHAKLAEISW